MPPPMHMDSLPLRIRTDNGTPFASTAIAGLSPALHAAAVVGLMVLGALAAWIPAGRAATVDPIQVLNRE